MKKFTLLFLMLFVTANIYAQTYTISFAATGAATTMDSVKVENLTHPATVTWHAGDVLQLVLGTGINETGINDDMLKVYPNPIQGQTEISFYSKQAGNVTLCIYDIAGKEVLHTENKVTQGTQKFQLVGLKQGMYFINISGVNCFYTAKLISQNVIQNETKIKYLGSEKPEIALSTLKNTNITVTMPYTIGDNLRFIGYSGIYTSILNDIPTSNKTITFAFTASGITTVLIPAGTFTMGSPVTELNRSANEDQYQVTISAFRMSKYEITNAQFAAFLNVKNIAGDGLYAAGAYPTQKLIYTSLGSVWGLFYTGWQWIPLPGAEYHPVVNVTWYGATEFATYAGGTLPTEAQWEYACRGNTTTPFNTGTCLSDTQAYYGWAYPYSTCTNTNTTNHSKAQVVGTYPANAFGLYDMHGNVCEWCSDWYGTYPTTPQTNPTGAVTGTARVFRGGTYNTNAWGCRSAQRGTWGPSSVSGGIGFRVVLVP